MRARYSQEVSPKRSASFGPLRFCRHGRAKCCRCCRRQLRPPPLLMLKAEAVSGEARFRDCLTRSFAAGWLARDQAWLARPRR